MNLTLRIDEWSFGQIIDIANNLHLFIESLIERDLNKIKISLMTHSHDISRFISTLQFFSPLTLARKMTKELAIQKLIKLAERSET